MDSEGENLARALKLKPAKLKPDLDTAAVSLSSYINVGEIISMELRTVIIGKL